MSEQPSNRIECRIRDSFSRQSLMASAEASVVSVESGRVTIAAPVGAGFRQQQGFAHGALVFALGDTAAGYAALTVMPEDAEVLTTEIKINYLSDGHGRLIATGRVLKSGRRLVVVAADVWAEDENNTRKHIAALQGTMIPVEGNGQ